MHQQPDSLVVVAVLVGIYLGEQAAGSVSSIPASSRGRFVATHSAIHSAWALASASWLALQQGKQAVSLVMAISISSRRAAPFVILLDGAAGRGFVAGHPGLFGGWGCVYPYFGRRVGGTIAPRKPISWASVSGFMVWVLWFVNEKKPSICWAWSDGLIGDYLGWYFSK